VTIHPQLAPRSSRLGAIPPLPLLLHRCVVGMLYLLIKLTSCLPGSSVSIVYGYGLDDRAIEVRSPTEARGFSSSLYVQTSSGAHPTYYPVGTEGPFPGAKARPGRDTDHSSHLMPRSRMSRSYIFSSPKRLHCV
jgi:hypothetical protein